MGPPPFGDPWAMKQYYTKQVRLAVASLCGTFGDDDPEIDDSTTNRRRLMLGEETYGGAEEEAWSQGNYVPVTLAAAPTAQCSAHQSSPELAAASACVAAASACVAASTACRTAAEPAAAAATAADVPTTSTTVPAVVPDATAGEQQAVDVSAASEESLQPPTLEEILAKVQELEDQGRMVEASALMVESMSLRSQASAQGID